LKNTNTSQKYTPQTYTDEQMRGYIMRTVHHKVP